MTSQDEWHTGNQETENYLTLNSEIERGFISSDFMLHNQEITKGFGKTGSGKYLSKTEESILS